MHPDERPKNLGDTEILILAMDDIEAKSIKIKNFKGPVISHALFEVKFIDAS